MRQETKQKAIEALETFAEVAIQRELEPGNYAVETWLHASDYLRAVEALKLLREDGDGWQDISTAPRDGTRIQVRHEDGTVEDHVYWSDERYCILGMPQGSRGPGWVSTEAGNLPIDPPYQWRPTPPQPEQKT
jgi:hypothetical protein